MSSRETQITPCCKCGKHGFTMLEIVAVLVILGVLSAVAVNRFTDIGAKDVAAANTLKAHLRYAQLRAMGDTQAWGLDIGSNAYTLYRIVDGSDETPVNLPGEDEPTKNDLQVDISGPDKVVYSPARGQPIDSAGQAIESDQVIDVGERQIKITQETGFIE